MLVRLLAVALSLGVVAVAVEPDAQAPARSTPHAPRPAAEAGIAGVDAATRLMLRGRRADADVAMRAALSHWAAKSARPGTAGPAPGSLEADVLAIRDVVFQPLGDPLLRADPLFRDDGGTEGWPARMPDFLVAPARLDVTVPGAARPTSVDVARQPPGLVNVIFVGDAERDRLARMVARLGGDERHEPSLMEVPNQPAGAAERIIGWWNGFFPARPGHWEGVDVETAPAFHAVAFTDAARTRATVAVRIAYAGATLVLEKSGGAWRIRAITDQWVM